MGKTLIVGDSEGALRESTLELGRGAQAGRRDRLARDRQRRRRSGRGPRKRERQGVARRGPRSPTTTSTAGPRDQRARSTPKPDLVLLSSADRLGRGGGARGAARLRDHHRGDQARGGGADLVCVRRCSTRVRRARAAHGLAAGRDHAAARARPTAAASPARSRSWTVSAATCAPSSSRSASRPPAATT